MYRDYFYGNEISDYGKKNGFVDYATLAKSFDHVLANDIIAETEPAGFYWYQESDGIDRDEIDQLTEERDELEEKRDEIAEQLDAMGDDDQRREGLENRYDELTAQIDEIDDQIDDLENHPEEVMQWYIVSDNGAEILKEYNEIVYRCDELDLNLWGVTHYGTSWGYVLTKIPCEKQ